MQPVSGRWPNAPPAGATAWVGMLERRPRPPTANLECASADWRCAGLGVHKIQPTEAWRGAGLGGALGGGGPVSVCLVRGRGIGASPSSELQ